MAGLLDLARRTERMARQVVTNPSNLAVEVAEVLVDQLTEVTPVDTSQALSNWQAQVGGPVHGAIPPYFPGEHGSTQAASAGAAQQAARSALANKNPGQPIYISNVVPYINRLNEGYSQQAPAGFIERSILIGRSVIRRFRMFRGS